MTTKQKKIVKEYVVSSVITFIATFLFAMATSIQGLSVEEVKIGALAGAALAGVRAAVKAVADVIALKLAQNK